MIARDRINKSRRMIANQHLAEEALKLERRGSLGGYKLHMLSIYSNMIANELVSSQDSPTHGQKPTISNIKGQIDATSGFEPSFEPSFEPIGGGMKFGANSIRWCTSCRAYFTKSEKCRHFEIAPEEVLTDGREIGLAIHGYNSIEEL